MENKYQDIKVGDEVFHEVAISYGWNSSKRFMVVGKVARVTATQFALETGERFKKSGISIGGTVYYNQAYRRGDVTKGITGKEVVDETEAMIEFRDRISLIVTINNRMSKFPHIPYGTKVDDKELVKLTDLIGKINVIMKKV